MLPSRVGGDQGPWRRSTRPRPPFTTSTLQQTAANRFGFTARKTMQIAQGLYEGVNIGSKRLGLITYMRTDSTRIAESALEEVRQYIGTAFPGDLPESANQYVAGKGAQDAHEAIRPTYVSQHARGPEEAPDLRGVPPVLHHLGALRLLPDESLQGQHDHGRHPGRGRLFRASSTRVVEKGFQKALSLLASKEQTKALPPLEVGGDAGAREAPPGAALHHGAAALHGRHHRQDPGGKGDRADRPPTRPSSRCSWIGTTWFERRASSYPRFWARSSTTCSPVPSRSCWTPASPRPWRSGWTR